MKFSAVFLLFFINGFVHFTFAQLSLNEGSNRNYLTISDENGDYPDWVEIHNAGADTAFLLNFRLSDDVDDLGKWSFPNIKLPPGEFSTVFCSGKDRKPVSGFTHVLTAANFNPIVGWNTHPLDNSLIWDGISNLLINICSYSSTGYTVNSVFNQSATPFVSTAFSFQDGGDAACSHTYNNPVNQRPNLQINGQTIGTGTIQNSPTDYPAPYGNWYWGARHQILVLASELSAAGLSAGPISSFAFDVASTEPSTNYDYISVDMCLVSLTDLSNTYETVDPNNAQHTNFTLSGSGEFVYLSNPSGDLINSLYVDCRSADVSRGRYPDGTSSCVLFGEPTPGATNNNSETFDNFLLDPVLSPPSGIYNTTVSVTIDNPNGGDSEIRYTLDGTEPTTTSTLYTGTPIPVFLSSVIKARTFAPGILPSESAAGSYLLGVDHVTPIISIATDPAGLYGDNGIFDHWDRDWQRQTQVAYLDSNEVLLHSTRAGMQIDGGWGGSRYQPQHSFRLEFDNSVLGEGPIHDSIIPFRTHRNKYSNFYLRNGSNQYLVFPYKDAFQNQAMSGTTKNYYSAWRPVSVYLNGGYFGLYELREKIDAEFFEVHDGADPDSLDILSLSAWQGFALRSLHGAPVQTFIDRYIQFYQLNEQSMNYWDLADQIFDMEYYADYIIAESWMGNQDWPGNNIKIMRSNKTGNRYRFCTIDMELCLQPNGWTSAQDDHIAYMLGQSPDNPFINVWLKSIQNKRFHDYFINRFADVMNTEYRLDRILPLEQFFFDQTVVEMQNEYTRWGDPSNVSQQMTDFYNNHLVFRNELSSRSTFVRQHIKNNFSLPNIVNLQLDVHPEGAGKIHISTIEPDTYPWQGYYFNGVPVKIEAIANPGYQFSYWGPNPLITNGLDPVFLDTLDLFNVSFNAYFEEHGLGISETEISTHFNLFPNPSTESVTIQGSGLMQNSNFNFRIVDLNGRLQMQGEIDDQNATILNITSLKRGIYIVQFLSEDGIKEERKLVKL